MANRSYGKKKETRRNNFFILPNEVFNQGFNVYELAVYAFLMRAMDRNTKQSYWSVHRIAEQCNMSENTCRKALHSLENQQFISISKRFSDRAQQTNIYTVHEI